MPRQIVHGLRYFAANTSASNCVLSPSSARATVTVEIRKVCTAARHDSRAAAAQALAASTFRFLQRCGQCSVVAGFLGLRLRSGPAVARAEPAARAGLAQLQAPVVRAAPAAR